MGSHEKIFDTRILTTNSDSLITRYYNGIEEASRRITPAQTTAFAPAFEYPRLNDRWEEFFSVARAALTPLETYAGRSVLLFDLMKNPGTHTTKTTASLLMVARAVQHIRTTGESILIFTPSSGNKAIALRDAVARALDLGLTTPDKLRIASLLPSASVHKIRRSSLTESTELKWLNPIMLYAGGEAADVKKIGKAFVERAAQRGGERIWFSLDIANYKVADACRAFYEYEHARMDPARRRVQAHAVSSAYGLLGYQHGLETMAGLGIVQPQPGYLLVQHLATSDMVRHYLGAARRHDTPVDWTYHAAEGIYTQGANPHFPAETWDTEENFEPTFYTHNPPTAAEMTALILAQGGSGIVVSLAECLRRYGAVCHHLAQSDRPLPPDPRRLAEWSLVMGATGLFNAFDRGLLEGFDEAVLHGSGMYLNDPARMPDISQMIEVASAEEVAKVVCLGDTE